MSDRTAEKPTTPETAGGARAAGAADDAESRTPLKERIQAKLSQAADEHKANATPESRRELTGRRQQAPRSAPCNDGWTRGR